MNKNIIRFPVLCLILFINFYMFGNEPSINSDDYIELARNRFISRYIDSGHGPFRINQSSNASQYPFYFDSFEQLAKYCLGREKKILKLSILLEGEFDCEGLEKFEILQNLGFYSSGNDKVLVNTNYLLENKHIETLTLNRLDLSNISDFSKMSGLRVLKIRHLKSLDPLYTLGRNVNFLRFTYDVNYISRDEVNEFIEYHKNKIHPNILDLQFSAVNDGVPVQSHGSD